MNIPSIFWLVPAASVVALGFAYAFYRKMKRQSEGTERMREIAGHVRAGAMAYLRKHDEDDRDDLVLLAQIGQCARTDMARELAHSPSAFAVTFHHPFNHIGATERTVRRPRHEI